MRQEMMGFWDAVASAGPYETVCTSLQTDNQTNTSSLMTSQKRKTDKNNITNETILEQISNAAYRTYVDKHGVDVVGGVCVTTE